MKVKVASFNWLFFAPSVVLQHSLTLLPWPDRFFALFAIPRRSLAVSFILSSLPRPQAHCLPPTHSQVIQCLWCWRCLQLYQLMSLDGPLVVTIYRFSLALSVANVCECHDCDHLRSPACGIAVPTHLPSALSYRLLQFVLFVVIQSQVQVQVHCEVTCILRLLLLLVLRLIRHTLRHVLLLLLLLPQFFHEAMVLGVHRHPLLLVLSWKFDQKESNRANCKNF